MTTADMIPQPAPTDRKALDTSQIILLRLEGMALLGIGLVAFASTGASWWLFAALILAPDLSAIGYAINARIGAWSYNLVHSYTGPAVTMAVASVGDAPTLLALGAIWWAHIGMDRAVGYGLKSPAGFKRTHLSF